MKSFYSPTMATSATGTQDIQFNSGDHAPRVWDFLPRDLNPRLWDSHPTNTTQTIQPLAQGIQPLVCGTTPRGLEPLSVGPKSYQTHTTHKTHKRQYSMAPGGLFGKQQLFTLCFLLFVRFDGEACCLQSHLSPTGTNAKLPN